MVLYLINAATDAKRQTCMDMTETSIERQGVRDCDYDISKYKCFAAS